MSGEWGYTMKYDLHLKETYYSIYLFVELIILSLYSSDPYSSTCIHRILKEHE